MDLLSPEQLESFRQCGLAMDVNGRLWHQGVLVQHERLRTALLRWLDRLPDGRYIIRLDAERFAYVEVADAPLIVRSLLWQPDGSAELIASDGQRYSLEAASLRATAAGVFYCDVRGLRARFLTPAAHALAERMIEEDGTLVVELAGARIAIPSPA